MISYSNPFFPFGTLAADTETSHLQKDRKKILKRENLPLFTFSPTLSRITQMLVGFVIVFTEFAFVQVLPFYLFSRLFLVFLITS